MRDDAVGEVGHPLRLALAQLNPEVGVVHSERLRGQSADHVANDDHGDGDGHAHRRSIRIEEVQHIQAHELRHGNGLEEQDIALEVAVVDVPAGIVGACEFPSCQRICMLMCRAATPSSLRASRGRLLTDVAAVVHKAGQGEEDVVAVESARNESTRYHVEGIVRADVEPHGVHEFRHEHHEEGADLGHDRVGGNRGQKQRAEEHVVADVQKAQKLAKDRHRLGVHAVVELEHNAVAILLRAALLVAGDVVDFAIEVERKHVSRLRGQLELRHGEVGRLSGRGWRRGER
eukprot:scaffold923_cov256-Pinguiococcus_pyrenoidosus.AAC.57